MCLLKIEILVIGMFILVSCNTINQDKKSENNIKSKSDINSKNKQNKKVESKYLSQTELLEFLKNTKRIEINSNYPEPFNTLKFDKVIAYDFDGREEHYTSIIGPINGNFSPIILRQKKLNLDQINFLIAFLTDNKTYGEQFAACFAPHFGIVFYKKEKIIFEVDICLDCNFLTSSIEFTATQHKKVKFDDGSSYGLKGFSELGKKKIIELSKQLDLDYGKLKTE